MFFQESVQENPILEVPVESTNSPINSMFEKKKYQNAKHQTPNAKRQNSKCQTTPNAKRQNAKYKLQNAKTPKRQNVKTPKHQTPQHQITNHKTALPKHKQNNIKKNPKKTLIKLHFLTDQTIKYQFVGFKQTDPVKQNDAEKQNDTKKQFEYAGLTEMYNKNYQDDDPAICVCRKREKGRSEEKHAFFSRNVIFFVLSYLVYFFLNFTVTRIEPL